MSHFENNAALNKRLTDSGLRPTPQREIVFKVILEKRDHPTVDDIFARVKSQMPTISLATVYNCLETLVQCGLVRQVNFERGASRYCPNLSEHAHFHDELTGEIHDIDVSPDMMTRLRALLPAGYDAGTVELTYRGSTSAKRPAKRACTDHHPHGTN